MSACTASGQRLRIGACASNAAHVTRPYFHPQPCSRGKSRPVLGLEEEPDDSLQSSRKNQGANTPFAFFLKNPSDLNTVELVQPGFL